MRSILSRRPSPLRPVSLSCSMLRHAMLLLVLALGVVGACAQANDAANFRTCLDAGTPAFGPGTSAYANLSTLGFRNKHMVPKAVVLAKTPAHVADAVRCARQTALKVCARSGGHSLVGKSLCNGVLVDVGPMRRVVFEGGGVADIGAGINMGELLWKLHAQRRWMAAGVCPGVGVGGYVFGGGHGPYEGTLGMACDSLVEVTLVDRFGKIIKASKAARPDLFFGLCGAGGGQFGIITSFKLRTAPSGIYDRGVVFHVTWEQKYAGQMLEKWMSYNEDSGRVWFRTERKFGELFDGYGACFDVSSIQECKNRLLKAPFYNTPGRKDVNFEKVTNAVDLHAFFGPEGGWGRFRAKNLRKAMLEQRYVDKGQANGRTYQSTFLRMGARPPAAFWQKWADFCANPGLKSIPWVVCEMNLFGNAINKPINNAFAHRDADVITHYIIGGGTKADRMAAYKWMENHFKPYITGTYVNYPELELKNYAEPYWGKSLPRLKQLKRKYDPQLFFANPQPIPRW